MNHRRRTSKSERVTHPKEQLGDELVACTIITKAYLSHARVLADSFLKRHPGARFFVLLVDEIDNYFDPSSERFQTVRLQELGIERIVGFKFRYEPLELVTAMKPFFFRHLLKKFHLKKLVYLDADILITGKLHALLKLLDKHNIVLTPHLTQPLEDNRRPSELDILRAGTYNAGFIAIANTDTTKSFLSWWSAHLIYHCFMDPVRGFHADQKWLELAVGMFDAVYVLREPGYNAAYWNMGTRHLAKKYRQWYANGEPLYFFHFSGFDPEKIDQISRHQNRFTLQAIPSYRLLFQNYRDLLHANDHEAVKKWPYSYATFDNGVGIPKSARKLYRESRELQQKYPDPFSTHGPDNYFKWLNSGVESRPQGQPITRLWHEIYKMRIDMQKAYPDIFGLHRTGFIGWVTSTGWREHEIDKAFIPKEYASVSPPPRKDPQISPSWAAAAHETRAIMERSIQIMGRKGVGSFLRQAFIKVSKREFRVIPPPTLETAISYPFPEVNSRSAKKLSEDHETLRQETSKKREFGVNLAGYFTGQFGVAASCLAFARAIELAGTPMARNKLVAEPHGEKRPTVADFSDDSPYAINLIHLNADAAESFFQSKGPDYARGRYNIGIWYWELPVFPSRWQSAFRFYDEIWATSSYIATCLSKVSPIPVVKMTYPLQMNMTLVDGNARHRFDLSDETCVFLFMFDMHSVFERKNPLGLLKAFEKAFGENDKTLLFINCINTNADPIAFKALQRRASRLNVRILKKHLPEKDYLGLLAACDCYVSLHRSEGLGLILAEAMYLGKPVIATAYSGNMDFMNLQNSLLVKYNLVELEKNYGPYQKGNLWAEPDIEHTAELLRWVYGNRPEAESIGRRASQDIKQHLNPKVTAREVKTRLMDIYERLERDNRFST